MRWSFGVEPLPQAMSVARHLRRVAELVLALEHEEDEVDRLIGELRRAADALGALAPTDRTPRVGANASSDGRVYVDHARDIGAFNPCFPEYDLVVDGDHASGTVTFPIVYEGPPGVVHGGFLAVFFDAVIQHHHCDAGVAGKTAALTLRYRRPVPLVRRLDFTLERSLSGGRIHSTGRLVDGERVLCEAEMDAVSGDPHALPEVSARRSRR